MKPLPRNDRLETTATRLDSASNAEGTELVTRHSVAESRRQLRILLAEDNEVNQELASTILRRRGYHVTVVNNGRAAVEEVTRGQYDIVLMDIQMPELDGFAATQAIRAGPARADLPIIALTALSLAGERERCLAQGMTGYLAKPFRPRELLAAVEGVEPTAPAIPVMSPTSEAAPDTTVMSDPSVPVDLAGFRRGMREAGAEAVVDHILDLFIQNAPQHLTALTEAIGSANGPAIERAAHAFKSPAGSIGARGLEQLLLELELAGKAGTIEQARATFLQMESEIESVLRYLHLEPTKGPIHD